MEAQWFIYITLIYFLWKSYEADIISVNQMKKQNQNV